MAGGERVGESISKNNRKLEEPSERRSEVVGQNELTCCSNEARRLREEATDTDIQTRKRIATMERKETTPKTEMRTPTLLSYRAKLFAKN